MSALVWVFALFLSDFFDTMGTLVGVGKPAGYLDAEGHMPDIRKPLLIDSLAAIAGGASSTSSATTYIESGSGVAAGGRTGWVSVVAGSLFIPFLFFAPLIGMVPAQATAAALIIVGYLMVSALTEAEDEAEVEEGIATSKGARVRRDRLPRHRDRPSGRARDHAHAVQLLDHERHRLRLHRVRPDPGDAGTMA